MCNALFESPVGILLADDNEDFRIILGHRYDVGRINDGWDLPTPSRGGIFVRNLVPRRCISGLGEEREELTQTRKKKGKERERERDGRKGESLSRDQRCGSGVDRCILRRVRVDRLDLLRLCLFMPASFFYFRPSSPLLIPSLSIPLLSGLRLAERAPQMNGITSSVSRGRDARRKF